MCLNEERVIDLRPPRNCYDYSATQIKFPRYIGYNNSAKWRRLKKIDNFQNKTVRTNQTMRMNFERLINYFDIHDRVKNFIKEDVEYRKPEKVSDMLFFTFDSILRNNFPITTSEFRKVVKTEFGIGRKIMSDLYPKKARDYTWFINKVLSNMNISSEIHQKIYIKVKENFDRLKKVIEGDPTVLISTLCYLSYKAYNLGKMPDHSKFFFAGTTYREYRKKLQDLGIKIKDKSGKTKQEQDYYNNYYKNNKEKWKEYYQNNIQKKKEYDKQYYQDHKEEIREYNKQYYLKNKGK